MAEAVAMTDRTAVLRTTIAQIEMLVENKDRLLHKKMLAEELLHRVRNNLQLIYGMLTRQLDETSDAAGQRACGRGIVSIFRTCAGPIDATYNWAPTQEFPKAMWINALPGIPEEIDHERHYRQDQRGDEPGRWRS
jgi:hypothetical protein